MVDDNSNNSGEQANSDPKFSSTTNSSPEPVKENISILERAQKIHDSTVEAEKRIDEKINKFETRIAETMLAGRGEVVLHKSKEQMDKEEIDKTVSKYFG